MKLFSGKSTHTYFTILVCILVFLIPLEAIQGDTQIDEKAILELGKDPGFNIRRLHKEGITGNGVGIAIIDERMLPEHIEYKDRLKKYAKLHTSSSDYKTIHGTAVASLAVGKTVGVAPGADLYFFEIHPGDSITQAEEEIYKATEEIVKINKELPKENRIRVISLSASLPYRDTKYADAVKLANQNDIFFISCNLKCFYGFHLIGLERKPENDPNKVTSYSPIPWKRAGFVDNDYYFKKAYPKSELLFAPYDSRTTANQEGDDKYTFHKTGCPSWEVPYMAGLYALACQAKPDITPELFWGTALKMGYYVRYEADNGKYYIGKIINPAALINELKRK